MKTIGIIGGMSWESSALYYKIINERVSAALGGVHSAKIIMYSVDFAEIEELQMSGDWAESGRILSEAARKLEDFGADMIMLATNTMHKIAGYIQNAISVPFIHIADVTADEIIARGIKKIGLLGTIYTMEQDFYKANLIARGLDVIIPAPADRHTVSNIIFDELVRGIVLPESNKKYLDIIRLLKLNGAEAVILGCTEIGMLVQQSDCNIPLFDTTAIHATKAADLAIGE